MLGMVFFIEELVCLGNWLRPMLDQCIGECMVLIYCMNNGIKEPTQPVVMPVRY